MVIAVRCAAPACRKYQLIEPHDRGKVVPCLICKTPIKVPPADAPLPAKPANLPVAKRL
jgi:hypothetical protein